MFASTAVEDPMTETNKSPELPGWIQDHLSRYIATDGADGYLLGR